MKNFLALVVALASAGWLVPLWLGVYAYLSFWQVEGWPLLQGAHPANSFPFLPFAMNCFLTAIVWLGVAVFGWSYVAARRWFGK